MPRHSSTSPIAEKVRLRSVIPLVLTAAGFAGGFAIAVFYNVALRPLPADSTLEVPSVTTAGPYASDAEPTRSYPATAPVSGERATDGSGGYAMDTPEARARAHAARLEHIRIDNVMRICTGC